MSKIFVQVLLPLALDNSFTYVSNQELSVGDIVLVEFGKKRIWGLVVEISLDKPKNLDLIKIKEVIETNQLLNFSQNHIEFINKIATYNLASRGLVLRAMMGILNSDKVKKIPQALKQEVDLTKIILKKLLPKQQQIFEEISAKIAQDKSAINLLDGVTGSGKTEIYFALIAQILQRKNSQILILLPEIALTSQLLQRFKQQFGFEVALWHSKISKKNKREIFHGIAQGSVRVVIGARSALLLPFKNLELLVIDEEHDSSFKQEDVFNFHARDMAIFRAKLENFPIIMASATPAVESYHNAVSGKYNHFILDHKFGQKNDIELIDLKQQKLPTGEFLSSKLSQEIAQRLQNKEQSLLFLNRRGYAPVTLCRNCGKKYECPNCDFHLVLHKSKNKLFCHHCHHVENQLPNCKFCGEEDSLISLGVGVEKLAEEVKLKFPQAKIALVTSDNVSNFDDVDNIVKQILSNEVDIIIGTQMIAKGHDFANLTLVGIVDIDSMLYSSELRALEKAYQMLTQVTGRAGRDKKKGQVIIQTYNPKNFIFEKILKSDKDSFYKFELNNRQILELPPFSRLAKFEISAFAEHNAKKFAKTLISNFPISDKIEILGPAPAAIQRLKNRHHFLVNLKASKKINLQKLIADVMQNIKIPNSIRVRIDIDPI